MKTICIRIISFMAIVSIVLSFAGCSSDNQNLLDKIALLESKVAELESHSNQELLDSIALLESKVAELESHNNQELLDSIALLESKVAELESGSVAKSAEIASLKSAVENLQDSKATLQSEVNTLKTDNNSNKAKLSDLLLRVEVLETSSTLYAQKINALELNSTSFETDLKQLSDDFSEFTDQLANASKIERTVLMPEDINPDNPFARAILPSATKSYKDTVSISCLMTYENNIIYPYQLITFNVTLQADESELDFFISATQPSSDTSAVGKTYITDIEYNITYQLFFNYVVLYRFL